MLHECLDQDSTVLLGDCGRDSRRPRLGMRRCLLFYSRHLPTYLPIGLLAY